MSPLDSDVPDLRVRATNEAEARPDGELVLYWMTASRRRDYNHGLERAVEWARELDRPLVVLEALRVGYRWASDRFHAFVLQGMADNERAFARTRALYYPYVEGQAGDGKGLVEALAARAAVVVTDDFPCFFLPRMLAAVSPRLGVLCEAVDSNGLMPLAAIDRAFPTAYAYRRRVQRDIPAYLETKPRANPLARVALPVLERLPRAIAERWPRAASEMLERPQAALADLAIDHAVGPIDTVGGHTAAKRALDRFIDERLSRYLDDRNQPERQVGSELSPYLHFGHISAREVFARIVEAEDWNPNRRAVGTATGKREGWWGMSAPAEAFLDQLVTWRELGYNFCFHRPDYDRYDSLPDWARTTLDEHAGDVRAHRYSLDDLEQAETHDPLWNAAQRQLIREGAIHNYLRMLWGKKILKWTESPQEALAVMVELNNKYALDGRNPNSYSGIFWVLGRFDRAWGPERPVFGKVRYMTSKNTARKVGVKSYLERYGA